MRTIIGMKYRLPYSARKFVNSPDEPLSTGPKPLVVTFVAPRVRTEAMTNPSTHARVVEIDRVVRKSAAAYAPTRHGRSV
jgi:hypothetical protein